MAASHFLRDFRVEGEGRGEGIADGRTDFQPCVHILQAAHHDIFIVVASEIYRRFGTDAKPAVFQPVCDGSFWPVEADLGLLGHFACNAEGGKGRGFDVFAPHIAGSDEDAAACHDVPLYGVGRAGA